MNRLALGCCLGFADALLEALLTAMTATVYFLFAFDLLLSHGISPLKVRLGKKKCLYRISAFVQSRGGFALLPLFAGRDRLQGCVGKVYSKEGESSMLAT